MATIKDVAEILVKINDEEAKKQLPALQQKVKDLNKQFDELRNNNAPNDKIKEVGKELKKTYEQAEALRKRTQSIDEAMQNISLSTPKELKRLMAQINGELNSGAIERGTKEWDEYCDKLKQVKAELKKVAEQQKVVEDAGLSFKDMLDIGGNLSMITASLLQVKDSIADFIRDNTQSYIALDAEMANVQKFTGLAREGVEELNAEFKKIDTRTSVIELNKLAEEAGRLGKTSKEDILGFVKAADIINVALDDLGEGATLEISKLTDIFGDEKALGTERSMLAVGSVINELSQNCTAAAPYLANFTKRLAGVGAQADMTIPQIMGFAAVLDSQGQAVEMSATAVSQLITKMFQDPAKIAKAVGMDIQEFTNLVKTDTNAALLTLLERLNSFGSMDVLAPLFKEMGTDGARASAVLASLAGNIDMVRQQQEIATQAYNDATSVVEEFTVQNETEEATLEKKRKKYEEAKVALGEELLPVMSSFVSTGSMIAKLLLSLIKFVKEHHKAIISIAAGLAAYTITVKAHTIATTATTTATKVWNLVTKAGTTLLAAGKIVVHASSLAYAKLTGNIVKATAAKKALNLVMKASPMGLVVGGITAAATALFSFSKRSDEAKRKEQERAEKQRELAEQERQLAKEREERIREYADVSASAAEEAKEEIDRLEKLYNLTQNFAESEEKRLAAAEQLKSMYPEYFKELDAEIILVGNAKSQYDKLTNAIKNAARARAAEDRIEELEKKRIELELQKLQFEDKIASYPVGATTSTDSEEFKLAGHDSDTGGGTTYAYGEAGVHDLDILANSYEIDLIDEKIKELDEAEQQLLRIIQRDDNVTNGGGGGSGTDDNIDPKVWLDRQNAINRTAYATGKIDYEKFLEDKHNIQIQYYNRMLKDVLLEENEKLNILADKAEEEQNWRKKKQGDQEKIDAERLKNSLADIDKKYESAKARETAWCYDIANENYGNEKILHEKLFQANVEYLKEKEQLYRSQGNNEEADKIVLEREKLVNDEKLRKQKEFLSLYNKLQKEYSKASSEEKMTAELATLDALHKEGIIKEVEYQELRKAIEEKYSAKGVNVKDSGFGDMLSNLYTSWDTLIAGTTDKTLSSMQKIGAVAQSTWAIAGAALQQYSAYSQACCDVEVAEIEAKYEKEIKAAGKNQKRVALLEEQKEKDIAKVKGKYNKKAMTIEMAQAVAQTAIAAINAYSSAAAVPVVGYILAPIAAAMAIAAGALQIETIKKQHQAQQAGYYHGGFTRRSANNREEVGVVHANEFVVNAAMTQDPRYKPLWSLIDYAQRNNAVPSLTPEDVSYALGTGAVVRATTTSPKGNMQNSGEILAVATSIGSSARAIDRLNRKLDEGIESFMVMDGERGFDRRYEEYKKMKNRPRR